MPYAGGQLNRSQIEAAARRTELQANLSGMESRYQRYVRANLTNRPDARYLKQCINDLKRQLRGR